MMTNGKLKLQFLKFGKTEYFSWKYGDLPLHIQHIISVSVLKQMNLLPNYYLRKLLMVTKGDSGKY